MAGDIGIQEAAIVVPAGQSIDDLDQLGVVGQRYGSRVVIAGLSASHTIADLQELAPAAAVYLDSGQDAPQAITEDSGLDEAEQLGLAAFDLRRSEDFLVRKANRPLAGESWGSGRGQAPDLPPSAASREARSAAPVRGTSDRLLGSVAVGLVIVEGPASDGLAFSQAERIKTVAEVQNGLGWLGSKYQVNGINWRYEIPDIILSVPPNPNLPDDDLEALWRDPAMASLGYGPGLDGVWSYIADLKSRLRTQWTYCAFITKYPVEHFAYADVGGPRLVLQYSNDGWGPDNIDRVFAHETGHIFGAPDEYASSECSCDGSWGYFGVPNLNCNPCAPGGSVNCIMSANEWEMCAYTPRHIGGPQWNIERNKTASTPFVADGVVYFQGTNDKLWRVDAATGRNQQQINNNTTASPPRVADGVVYFRGTNNKLWRVNIDGTNQQQINNNTTSSTPCIADGVVYFQGTNNKLWRVNIDGTNQQQINKNSTASTPYVADGVVYFQGTNNKLWRVNIDGTSQQQIAGNSTASTPFVTGGVVYFQGTNNKLWRVNIDGTNQQQINKNSTASTPYVADGVVYFQGTNNKLWRVNIDGTSQQQLADNWTAAAPFVADGIVYFRGTNDLLWLVSAR